ncbi:MAG TPA: hypothetical protein VFS67_08460 [Polyangiaceae bacterium]|nr:hypothetical protein [Polyangiaceae bacterium]
MQLFQEALDYRQTQPDALATRIAKWCVGKALRALARTERALEVQQALLAEYEAIGKRDGFVFEELAECHDALGDKSRARRYFALAYAELSRDRDFVQHEAARLERIGKLGGVL